MIAGVTSHTSDCSLSAQNSSTTFVRRTIRRVSALARNPILNSMRSPHFLKVERWSSGPRERSPLFLERAPGHFLCPTKFDKEFTVCGHNSTSQSCKSLPNAQRLPEGSTTAGNLHQEIRRCALTQLAHRDFAINLANGPSNSSRCWTLTH